MAKAPPRARSITRQNISSEIVVGPKSRAKPADGQVDLFAEPMPSRIVPCLAKLADKPPAGTNWAYEIKWDGYRVAVHIEPGRKVRVLTKGGFDWTERFPDIAAAAASLKVESCIIDGEAVVLDEQGRSDFQALQAAVPQQGRTGAPMIRLCAFDLLHLDGIDYRKRPLSERRKSLEALIPRKPSAILLSEEVVADGETFFRIACGLRLEGIIAKKLNAPYRSGRGGEWVKIKCVQSETFAIVGYRPGSRAAGGLARLMLAARRNGRLEYVGSVGTGFSAKAAQHLLAHLKTIGSDAAPVPIGNKRYARWVTPVLAAEIEFRGWTTDRKLRHASYKGLRDNVDEPCIYQITD